MLCLLCHLSDQLCDDSCSFEIFESVKSDTFRFHHLGQFYWCLHAEVLIDLHHFLCELDSDMVVVFVDLVTSCVEINQFLLVPRPPTKALIT